MDKEIIANIKSLALDMINQAKSGHPGIVLSSAPILYTLYANHLNIAPFDKGWYNRDRFILSAGHGSALLYSTLFMSGYNITLDDLKGFRQLNSKTPGHPELGVTPGVECSTGPLGQGIANAVGVALGEKILHTKYPFYNFKTYVLVGDGDLMEGISYEACSLAGTLNLNNLIVLYDSNNMTLDGKTNNTFKEKVRERFEAMGFNTYLVKDGNDIKELNEEINKAKKSDKPAFIEIKTKLGDGSLLEDTNTVHGKPLTDDDLSQLKNKLGVTNKPFYVNEIARNEMIKKIENRIKLKYDESIDNYKKYIIEECNSNFNSLNYLFHNYNYNILNYPWQLPREDEATRVTNQNIMCELAKGIPMMIGGSADLNSSTKVYLSNMFDITPNKFDGKNIWFGIREHSMGAILNGLALLNFRPFSSTFLSFSDYQKPAIRMSALMGLPVTYIYSHDSILVGMDGPTHQPVEQLAMLRSIPNLDVYRPCDAKELVGCWKNIISSSTNPSALILSRSKVKQQVNTDSKKVLKGAYVLEDSKSDIDLIIVSTGTEVETAIKIKQELNNYNIRVVSMPCKELFYKQSIEYQESVLIPNIKTVVIEASSSYGWEGIATNKECLITIDKFGKSGKPSDVLKALNYDYESIKNRVINILNEE